jgi:hypothetical protein
MSWDKAVEVDYIKNREAYESILDTLMDMVEAGQERKKKAGAGGIERAIAGRNHKRKTCVLSVSDYAYLRDHSRHTHHLSKWEAEEMQTDA